MLLTILAYGMIIIFMYVIMKKKLSPFTSLVIIPLIFTLIAIATGVASQHWEFRLRWDFNYFKNWYYVIICHSLLLYYVGCWFV